MALGQNQLIFRNLRNNKKYNAEFMVIDADCTPLLGRKVTEKMKLITVNYENIAAITTQEINKEPEQQKCKLTTAEHLPDKVCTSIDAVLSQYPSVFDGTLGKLPGIVHFHVDDSVVPVVRGARRVPTSLEQDIRKELSNLVEKGVILPVEEPSEWVSQMAVGTKKSGALRICIDPRPLNTALKRSHYQLPTMDEVLPSLSKARIISKLDLEQAFWHCQLDDESSKLTTFATPKGRYQWLRLPFGTSVSSEEFQKQLNQALDDIDGILCVADDILVYGVRETDEEATIDHHQKMQKLLQRCTELGIRLNKSKSAFCKKEVEFLGHLIMSDGLKPDPAKLSAILKMQQPTSILEIQRLNGTVNYLARFLPQLSMVMQPLMKLSHKDQPWIWGSDQERAFCEVKQLVTQTPVLTYFDVNKPLTIQCDASEKGLGAVLLQDGRPVAYASRALREVETRYAQIEKELLAIVWSIERFHQYTFGVKVNVQSDHKPLETLMKKPLAQAPRRLQGMMMRLMKYDTDIVYTKGTHMYIADMLSRAYLQNAGTEQTDIEQVNAVNHLPMRADLVQKIQDHTTHDESLTCIKEIIQHGWPQDKSNIPHMAIPYWYYRDELTVTDGLIFRGERLRGTNLPWINLRI